MHKTTIDNTQDNLLINHVNQLLQESEFSGMAVGYFYLSGFEAIQKNLQNIKNLRLIIGNRTDQKTVEELSKGHLNPQLSETEIRRQKRQNNQEKDKIKTQTAQEYAQDLELMEQNQGNENGLLALWELIQEGRINIRVFTKGFLHSKAYLFDFPQEKYIKGVAIVGSSNLTISGLRNNSELNVRLQQENDYVEVKEWFENLWKESEDYNEAFMNVVKSSWFKKEVSPYDIYIKTLYNLVRERIEITEHTLLTSFDQSELYPFQKDAYNRALDILENPNSAQNGVFISDVVGLGKSFIAIALISYYWSQQQKGTLVICPASLKKMWEDYRDEYHLRCKILSSSELKLDENEENPFTDSPEYAGYGVVVIDESHNFRNPDTIRYQTLEPFLQGKKVILLTATPQNNSVWDIYYQIKLFHQSDITDLNISPNNLREYFKKHESNTEKIAELLQQFLIRRTRNDIKKNPKYAEWVANHRFPTRKLNTLNYNIEEIYSKQGKSIYEQLINMLFAKPSEEELRQRAAEEARKQKAKKENKKYKAKKINIEFKPDAYQYFIYDLTAFLKKDQLEKKEYIGLSNLGELVRGLLKTLLFKRLESSVTAFYKSIERIIKRHENLLASIEKGFILTGDALTLSKFIDAKSESESEKQKEKLNEYPIADFEGEKLKAAIEKDKKVLEQVLELVKDIYENKKEDTKFKCFLENVIKKFPQEKVLVFSEFSDTVNYLEKQLKAHYPHSSIQKISSAQNRNEKAHIVGRFSPKSQKNASISSEKEIQYLITTDVLSEGQNLQDARIVVNYDFHWNPVRLIQRIGRVDRIGSTAETIEVFNFLPDTHIEKQLALKERVQNRINQIQAIFGADSKILSDEEILNENSLFAIYSERDESILDADSSINTIYDKAEQILRNLQNQQPEEYQRIITLKDGVRCATTGSQKGMFTFLQSGNLQKLYFYNGEILNDNIAEVLELIKASPDLPKPIALDTTQYNAWLKPIYQHFKQELYRRQSEKEQTKITPEQRYFNERLKQSYTLFMSLEHQKKAEEMHQVFAKEIPSSAQKRLRELKKRNVPDSSLLAELQYIIDTTRILKFQEKSLESENMIVRTICSEGLGI